MTSESLPELFVLYGSQTGNAESIAKDLSELLIARNIDNKLMTLNGFKSIPVPANGQTYFLLVICSTTGNGDCPENADAWFRSIKLRSAAKDKFAHHKYMVMGLGDTNYDKFCFMGKTIDKRLGELGGERVSPVACVDEATGLEEAVESWKASTLTFLEKTFLPEGGEEKAVEIEEESKESLQDLRAQMINRRSTTKVDCQVDVLDALLRTTPEGIKPISYFLEAYHLQDVLNQPLEEDKRDRRCCSDEITARIVSDPQQQGEHEAKGTEPQQHDWTMQRPFFAKVSEARWLTDPASSQESLCEGTAGRYDWGEAKRVVHVRLSLAGSGITYVPGDSIGVCCPNPPYAVKVVLRRLQQVHQAEQLSADTRILLSHAKTPQTLSDILSYHFDLCGAPKKSCVKLLSKHCQAEDERKLMAMLCGREAHAKTLWKGFIEQQRIGVAELLLLFPSCMPTMSQLFSVLCPAVPRYYSIASSPLCDAQTVAFAFSTVRYTCEVTNQEDAMLFSIRRSGVCTLFMEHALRSWLHAACYGPPDAAVALKIFHKPTHCFHLPGNVGTPLILVGPGTGVAPFISFISHRANQQRKRSGEGMSAGLWRGCFELDELDLPCEGNTVDNYISSVTPGQTYLFFGCRNEKDFLFEKELQGFVQDRAVTCLEVAMSRKTDVKVYVTHKLHERGAEVAALIMEGAHVYICGDGNKMAKDVMTALKEIVAAHAHMTAEEAAHFVSDMQHRHRLLLDIWSP